MRHIWLLLGLISTGLAFYYLPNLNTVSLVESLPPAASTITNWPAQTAGRQNQVQSAEPVRLAPVLVINPRTGRSHSVIVTIPPGTVVQRDFQLSHYHKYRHRRDDESDQDDD